MKTQGKVQSDAARAAWLFHHLAGHNPTRPVIQRTRTRGAGTGHGARAAGERVGAVRVSYLGAGDIPITSALGSPYQPSGALLLEAQGQEDLAMSDAMARKLKRSMDRDGRDTSDATVRDATAAGALALTRWRNINASHQGARARGTAAAVAWRAVVDDIKRDTLGERESTPLHLMSCETLADSALPLPPLLGYGSRDERAAAIRLERARARRPFRLSQRIEALKARGGRGRRAALLDKLHHAALLLLQGHSLGDAAAAAGFLGDSRYRLRAEDRLVQAARRLGLKFQFNLRQVESQRPAVRYAGLVTTEEFTDTGDAVRVLRHPMTRATAAMLDGAPSSGLPLQDGRGARHNRRAPSQDSRRRGREQRAIERAARRRFNGVRWDGPPTVRWQRPSAAQKRHARQQARAARPSKGAAFMARRVQSLRVQRQIDRAARRAVAKSGLWFGKMTAGNRPVYRGNIGGFRHRS